jgi:hypothetical protein
MERSTNTSWHTGLLDGVFWGSLVAATGTIVGLTVVAVAIGGMPAFLAVEAGKTTLGVIAATLAPQALSLASAGVAVLEAAPVVGALVAGGTILHKRHQHEKASNTINSSEHHLDGRVSEPQKGQWRSA